MLGKRVKYILKQVGICIISSRRYSNHRHLCEPIQLQHMIYWTSFAFQGFLEVRSATSASLMYHYSFIFIQYFIFIFSFVISGNVYSF